MLDKKDDNKCTYPGCTENWNSADPKAKGKRGAWEWYLCKKHQKIMGPLINNEAPVRVPERKIG